MWPSDGSLEGHSNAADEPLRLPAFDAAIRDGLEGAGVRRYLRGLGFTPADYDPLADRMPDGRLIDREAKHLRLRAAGRLEADLERRRARPGSGQQHASRATAVAGELSSCIERVYTVGSGE
ncbi:hypothetical protein A6E15_15340 [Natrinema saccharevitans]|uniref:Uncharacterized protein n=1 Tax=Natrinema saccharevitans TaxID=301967 RepID=A0A1S8AZS8_9EURY|nr:hypothetical protein A6E15_15340 [Natrinema saccharevitans]